MTCSCFIAACLWQQPFYNTCESVYMCGATALGALFRLCALCWSGGRLWQVSFHVHLSLQWHTIIPSSHLFPFSQTAFCYCFLPWQVFLWTFFLLFSAISNLMALSRLWSFMLLQTTLPSLLLFKNNNHPAQWPVICYDVFTVFFTSQVRIISSRPPVVLVGKSCLTILFLKHFSDISPTTVFTAPPVKASTENLSIV